VSIHTLDVTYATLLYLCAVGQTVFVGAWLTTRWYKFKVGRALMFKSASLAAVLDTISVFKLAHAQFALSTFYKIYIILFLLLFLGVSSQDIAIFTELRKEKKNRENRKHVNEA
jgi:hypothetical protein